MILGRSKIFPSYDSCSLCCISRSVVLWGKISRKQIQNKVISPVGCFNGDHKCSNSKKIIEVLASLETKKHYDDLRKHLFKENTAIEAARNQLDPHKNPFQISGHKAWETRLLQDAIPCSYGVNISYCSIYGKHFNLFCERISLISKANKMTES